MNDLKRIALDYFIKNPEAKRRITECGFHLGLVERPNQSNSLEDLGIGISKEKISIIKKTLLAEELKYKEVLERGKRIVKKFKPEEITGELLCELHHTYGIDPNTVEDILNIDLPSKLHDEYLEAYEKHKQTGKAGLKKEIVLVKSF